MTRIILIVLTLLAIVAAGLWYAGLRIAPLELRQFDPQAAIAKADTYDATITRDAWGVPRVIGARDADAAFGFAFAHAEDDFATIQASLRASLGPQMLAKGESEARTAYLIQSLGILETVGSLYEEQLSQRTRAFLEGYADGLNYFAALHPQEAESDLFPVAGQDVAALSAFFSPLFYGMSRILTELVNPDAKRSVARGQEIQVRLEDIATSHMGSNAIAVAPERSEDGATRVIVNSHQPVEGPLAWYEGHLISGEGLEFAGGAFPGGPVLHLGGNSDFAQAATVNRPDLIDVYELTLTGDGTGYMLDGVQKVFESAEARMLVRLFGPFAWEVRRPIERSEHGPVLRTPRGVFAIRYATMDDLQWAEQSYLMMRARSLNEFEEVMRMQAMGATNRVVGDREGGIARYYNARMPKRPADPELNWKGILPGDRSDLIWTEFEPFDALPHMIEPQAGYVLDSNHTPYTVTLTGEDPDAEDYPKRFGIETDMTNRGLRSTVLLAGDPDGRTSRADLLAVKYDNAYHPDSLALSLRQDLLAMDWSDAPDLSDALEIIEAWDGRANGDNPHAALSLLTYQPIGVALFLRQEPPELGQAFRDAVSYLQTHHGRLDPPWETVNRLKRGEVDLGLEGGPDTLRAVNSTPDDDGTLRMVSGDGLTYLWEALADGTTKLWAVHQYGASNRPESPHFTDQMALFVTEQFREVPLGEEAVRAAAKEVYRPGDVRPAPTVEAR